MKVVKSQVVLFMHEQLLLKNELDPEYVKTKFELETKTFLRYIQEIRAYYANMYKSKTITYSKIDNKYYLK